MKCKLHITLKRKSLFQAVHIWHLLEEMLWCKVIILYFAVLSGPTVVEVGGVGYVCLLLVHRY